jgi:hypothetical protein
MKLNKNLIKNNNNINLKKKFLNCSPSSLKRGDYIQLFFFYMIIEKRVVSLLELIKLQRFY